MPSGIRRSMGPVVSMALLMPPVAASAQEGAATGQAKGQIVTEAAGSFVIRSAGEAPPLPPAAFRLGRTIRIDAALIVRTQAVRSRAARANPRATTGGIHETR
ncbi:hypothetical protein KRR38_08555 [Novosphingobium sp. G106]|uniref:hypothetical protein n=1 Tax=Novosphingobium sp. G106 TaxID=2849500 RepID=UPI001C2D17ED|nr:hypothetical protein [Novosphingobium sp. G106]MBV1687724.1 hypothetical protein [Novosphingobium sp. G106]